MPLGQIEQRMLAAHDNQLKTKILVYDKDVTYLDRLKESHKHKTCRLVTCHEFKIANQELDNKDEILVGMFCGLNSKAQDWISLVRKAQHNAPLSNKFLMGNVKDVEKLSPYFSLEKLGIDGVMEHQPEISKIIDKVAHQILAYTEYNGKRFIEEATTHREYTPISAVDFIGGSKAYFDVYVQLAPDKFLKILFKNDAFDLTRVRTYLTKGVKSFYIKKSELKHYFDYCEALLQELLKSKGVSEKFRVSLTLSLGDQALTLLKEGGLSDENINYAERFLTSLSSTVNSLLKQQNNILMEEFLKNQALYDHGVNTCFMTSILARDIGLGSDKPQETVGLATLFHDIGLVRLGHPYTTKDPNQMNVEEFKIYQTHPQISARELTHLKINNSTIVQAIEQHHMRLKGGGFPTRLPGTPVHKMAEIIGICDEVMEFIKNNQYSKLDKLLEDLDLHVFPQFSLSLVRSCKKVFFPNIVAKIEEAEKEDAS